ncbi:MAG TPA: PilZ domain-containing protein [Spirochaetota bacterium]|nr:PilZ domain-containing protein [Spirochaetota bacterium]HPJ33214.1 PilZ domain-containing protein [Spirochaetota bacterium]
MDKREYPRYDKDLQVDYAYQQKVPTTEEHGRILNISLGGIYMLSGSILEKGMEITLTFTINKNNKMTTLTTTGSVLRSGKISDEPEMSQKYDIKAPENRCFAVIKFNAPFIELSFMLH